MVGSSVGPYRVLGEIGTGGMSKVFLAQDPDLKRRVALKCLTVADDNERKRILHEASLTAGLSHPNIATVYHVLEHDGRSFIVMEYAEGPSLRERLARERLPIGEVVTIGRQLASALAKAHEERVIHRDLKPANVHVSRGGHVKVLDFGIALREHRTRQPDDSTTSSVSNPIPNFRLVGTPAYMAPEQLTSGYVDKRSDIYSLGVILFEMATGRRPFETPNAHEQREAVTKDPAPAATSIDARVPSGLNDVIAKALERDPAKRFESAREIERALTDIIDATRIEPWWDTGVRWGIRLTAAAIVLTLAAMAPWPSLVNDVVGRVTARNPTVLAVLPHANPSGDPIAEQFGLAIGALVARNFRAAPGVKIVSGERTAPYATARTDLEPLRRDVGASYVLDLTVRAVTPSVDVLARLRRPGAGVPEWEKSITGDAVEVETMLLTQLADALRRNGIRPRSDAEANALTRLSTTDSGAQLAYLQARALLESREVMGNAKRAADLLEQATSKDPRFALGYAALSDAMRVRSAAERDPKLLERAASASNKALELDPEESAAHAAFAAVEYTSGRRDAAVTAVRRAIDLQPDNDEAHRLLGQVLASQGRVDDGVKELRTALRLRPNSFHHYSTLGLVLFTASRYDDAIEAYHMAAEIRPSHAGTYEMLGAIYQMQGDTDRAIGNYEHAIRLGPSSTTYANLAFAYFTAGEYDKARSALLTGIERDPKKASLHRDLGDVYLRLNRRAEARAAYERAIALSQAALAVNAQDPFSIVLIGLCEANLGRRSRAERHATEAMALAPTNRDVLFRSAKVFALTGNRGAAMDALRRAVEGGYDREVARRDPELAALRSLPEFERVLSAAPPASRR
jgi:tetratricopeptide (TPR) repeat protein/TolB-like protein